MGSDAANVFVPLGVLAALGTAAYVYGLLVVRPRRDAGGPGADASAADLAGVAQTPNQTPASGQPTTRR
jgi:hypothetical protein